VDQGLNPPPAAPGMHGIGRRSFGALGSGAISLLLFASLFVLPVIGVFVAPLGLIPLLQYAARHPSGVAAWGWVVVALGVVAVASGTTMAVLFFVGYVTMIGLPSMVIEQRRRSGWSDGRWLLVTVLGGLALVLLTVAGLAWPRSPMVATSGWLSSMGTQALDFYKKIGVSTTRIQLALDASERNLTWVLPAVPVAYLSAVLFWIRSRLPLLGFGWEPVPFEEYRNDEWLAVGFVLGGLGTLFTGGTLRWIAVNLLAGALILYFIQGLAMIRAHLVRFVGRGWFVRWGVALLCLQVPFPAFVAALGIMDSFHSLRPKRSDDT